jgi:hypothetical protein
MGQERRSSERYARRVEVRFWRRGETQPHTGFTTNVSTSGLFLATSHSLQPGERLRLEITDRAGGFAIEGQVARVHRVSISLRHVAQPGAGIRFLAPAELVASLLPEARQTGGSGRGAGAERSSPEARLEAASLSAASALPGQREPEPAPDLPVVVVEFGDRTGFLSVYHRDLAAGSLHVSTDVPAKVQDRVMIELRPPLPESPVLRFEAVVVHRFEPRAVVGRGGNVLAGMGVRFVDPARLRTRLEPILEQLRQ